MDGGIQANSIGDLRIFRSIEPKHVQRCLPRALDVHEVIAWRELRRQAGCYGSGRRRRWKGGPVGGSGRCDQRRCRSV
jgi:hypothetical protein